MAEGHQLASGLVNGIECNTVVPAIRSVEKAPVASDLKVGTMALLAIVCRERRDDLQELEATRNLSKESAAIVELSSLTT